MTGVSNHNAEIVGEELGLLFIKFKHYSPPKKLAVIFLIFFICSFPYYLIFNMNMNPAHRRLRGI